MASISFSAVLPALQITCTPNGRGAIHRGCSHADADMCDVRGERRRAGGGVRWPVRHGADELGGGSRNSLTPFGVSRVPRLRSTRTMLRTTIFAVPHSTKVDPGNRPTSASLGLTSLASSSTSTPCSTPASCMLAPLLPTRRRRLWLPRPRDSGCSLDGAAVRSISPPSAC